MSLGWTRESVDAFLKNYPVDTGGAITLWEPTITEIDDGDVFFRVGLPFWPQNRGVVGGVLRAALSAHEKGADVCLAQDQIVLRFYSTVCDPD